MAQWEREALKKISGLKKRPPFPLKLSSVNLGWGGGGGEEMALFAYIVVAFFNIYIYNALEGRKM